MLNLTNNITDEETSPKSYKATDERIYGLGTSRKKKVRGSVPEPAQRWVEQNPRKTLEVKISKINVTKLPEAATCCCHVQCPGALMIQCRGKEGSLFGWYTELY